jgi:hypothetical protein
MEDAEDTLGKGTALDGVLTDTFSPVYLTKTAEINENNS